MSNTSDQLNLSDHWHLDCRIIAELPEDRVIGTRFLINVFIAVITASIALCASWLLYVNLGLRQNIHEWETRMAEQHAEVGELQRLQTDYTREAKKIDHAYELIQNPFVASRFVLKLGRTHPEVMRIERIESNISNIVIRGSLNESSERASITLSNYIRELRVDPELGPLFSDIVMTDFQRVSEDGKLNFEITFRFRGQL